MKITMTMLAATLVLATGCSKQADSANNAAVPANEANVTGSGTVIGAGSGNEAAANPSLVLENQASVAPSGAAPDRAFVIGRWGPDAACSQVVEFHADGSVTPPEGASWTMAGNRLTMSLPGRPVVTTTLSRVNDNEMTATRRTGSTFSMFRCR